MSRLNIDSAAILTIPPNSPPFQPLPFKKSFSLPEKYKSNTKPILLQA